MTFKNHIKAVMFLIISESCHEPALLPSFFDALSNLLSLPHVDLWEERRENWRLFHTAIHENKPSRGLQGTYSNCNLLDRSFAKGPTKDIKMLLPFKISWIYFITRVVIAFKLVVMRLS